MHRSPFHSSIVRAVSTALLSTAVMAGSAVAKNGYPLPPIPTTSHDQILELSDKLAHTPECMSLLYLNYVLGAPSNEPLMRDKLEKRYYWYNSTGSLEYELDLTQPSLGITTAATFIAHLPDNELDLQDVEENYDKQVSKKFFDQRCNPTAEYCFTPNTLLDFTQPPDTFSVRTITVTYGGPPLAQPPMDQLLQMSQQRRESAFEHHKNQRYSNAIPLMTAHLDEHPEDVETRVALAEALKNSSHLNESIAQYRIAMSQATTQPTIDACKTGLQQLRVLPSVDADLQEQHHDVKVVNRGQRFHQGDLRETKPLSSIPPLNQPAQSYAGQPGPAAPAPVGLSAGPAKSLFTPPVAPSFKNASSENLLDIQPFEPPMLFPKKPSNGYDPVAGF